MAEFIAHFVGGPCDGQSMTLRVDLETVEWMDVPVAGSMSSVIERPAPPKLVGDRHFYRRSMRTRDVYVYQP